MFSQPVICKESWDFPELLHALLKGQGSYCLSTVIASLIFCRKNPELFQDLSFLWWPVLVLVFFVFFVAAAGVCVWCVLACWGAFCIGQYFGLCAKWSSETDWDSKLHALDFRVPPKEVSKGRSFFRGHSRWRPDDSSMTLFSSLFGQTLRADFWEGDEDSNYSVCRVRRFTEWPGPLHLSAPQRCNAERSDAQHNFFASLFIPPFYSVIAVMPFPVLQHRHVNFLTSHASPFRFRFHVSFRRHGLLYTTTRNLSRVTTQRCRP